MTLRKPDLVFLKDDMPGFTRRRHGKGFSYLTNEGDRISDKNLIKRIKKLVIPPMWEKVWICPKQNGYLQATGRDLKRRKQYIYHTDYVAWQQWNKFRKMRLFAETLPLIRQTTDEHLLDENWTKRKVLALIVKVLDETAVRMANQYYTDRNETYGLTTLRRRHLDLKCDHLTFSYTGKSSKHREVTIDDKKLEKLIKECSELPGYELFRYRENGSMHSIESADVNEYLQEISGEEITGKDFRTWTATYMAVELYPEAKMIGETNTRKKIEPALVRLVSKKLGNTMSVCREYYIHPKVLQAVKNQKIPAVSTVSKSDRLRFDGYLEDAEILALRRVCF